MGTKCRPMQNHLPFPFNSQAILPDKQLIITADDFGAADCINQGIIRAIEAGVVNTVSAMVNFPGSLAQIRALHQRFPNLPIGVHLNLTSGVPLSEAAYIASLLDYDRAFYTIERIGTRIRLMEMEEVEIELRAQIEAFLSLGIPLDHISFHHNLPVFAPVLLDSMIRFAHEYQSPLRMPLCISMVDKKRFGYAHTRRDGLKVLGKILARNPIIGLNLLIYIQKRVVAEISSKLKHAQVRHPHFLIDAFYGLPTPENLKYIFQQLPNGISELVVHLGVAPGDERIPKGINKKYLPTREYELYTLESPYFKEWLNKHGIKMATFSDL